MLYPIYRTLTSLSAPVLKRVAQARLQKGKEDPSRFTERFGVASKVRPSGKLIWIHGASVGESLSILPLLNVLQSRLNDWHFLVTTGTLTSAELMAQRLPPNVVHQFVPWDHPKWVAKFMDHWRPDAVLWLESELWPNILYELKTRNIAAGLLNARMRPTTFQKWQRAKTLAAQMLGTFQFIFVGARDYIRYFKALGGRNVSYIGSLKFGAKALPVDAAKLTALKVQIGDRPCLGFLQTHPTEEALGAGIFKALKKTMPDLLMIVAPRKNTRGAEIVTELTSLGLNVALRTTNDTITAATDIYVADTIGDMGLWYSLCPVAIIGGSFIPHGGQNPIEGSHFGTAILYGPHMFNFPELCAVLEESKAAIAVATCDELLIALQKLYADPAHMAAMKESALALSKQNHSVIDAYAEEILLYLIDKK